MKSKYLLIICFFIIGSFTQSSELSYFQQSKKSFAPGVVTPRQDFETLGVKLKDLFTKDLLNNGAAFSPTTLHLKNIGQNVISYDISKQLFIYEQFLENPELKNLYADFRKKEREFNQQGYYTFVHGQRRQFYLPQRLYTHLWELQKKRPIKNFLFIHLNDLVETEEAKSEEKIMRKIIHQAGTSDPGVIGGVDFSRFKKVLFMNYAFFANATWLGSNSAYFVIQNQNIQPIIISIIEPFKLLGYEWIYKKYKQEIEQLNQDYNQLSNYGNMLLIAVPKDKIYKLIYICNSLAEHSPVLKKDGTKITDIRLTMDTLFKNPESLVDSDQLEFCLIMTQVKGGLDPSTGIQIYPLLSGDPEKLKVLQEREKILLDKITADIKEAEKQQAMQRAAKITGHVVESAQAK